MTLPEITVALAALAVSEGSIRTRMETLERTRCYADDSRFSPVVLKALIDMADIQEWTLREQLAIVNRARTELREQLEANHDT